MVDFLGPGQAGIYDDARIANQYARESDEAADARWTARERRARYDEANRLNRRISAEDAAAYQQQAGLFTSMDDELAGTTRRSRAPVAMPTSAAAPTNRQSVAAPAPSQSTNSRATPPIVEPRRDLEAPIEQRQYSREELRNNPMLAGRIQNAADRGEIVLGNLVGGNLMVYPRTGSPRGQPHIGPVYFPRGFGLGIDPRWTAGHFGMRPLPRRQLGETDATVDPMADIRSYPENRGEVPEVTSEVGLSDVVNQVGSTTPTSARTTGTAGVATPGQDPIYEQWNDTSRSMEQSPEMRLIEATIQNGIRRAQTYAQHGRADLADEAFTGAVERQLAYFQMGNMAMLRSAASGNLSAAEALIARANSYPRDAVQLAPVEGTDRVALQIQGEDGSWASASSMTRPQLFNSLRAYADAAGAAADAESQQAIQIAMMNNERYLAIADMEQRTAVMRILHETGRAELAQRVELQIARGQARMYMNSETGGAYITYMDDQGNPAYAYTSMEDVPTPGTNGNETVEMPVMRNITSMNGVRPNQ